MQTMRAIQTAKQTQYFAVKVTPGPECSSFQFASAIMFHLKCECQGLDCDMYKDWDGKTLFWISDWQDWSNHRESEVLSSLEFFAKRFLREQKIPAEKLKDYLNFEILRV